MSDYLEVSNDHGVAVITMDNPRDKLNTLGRQILEEFGEVLDQLEANGELKAAVLISAKKDNFIAGADIEMLAQMREPGEAEDLSARGHRMLNRLASLKIPMVAAIHGACLGGGLEVALACHYRMASDDRKTVFGLPEVKLGLLPGGGGTQRLPRLIGLTAALDMLLTGKNVYPHKACKIGLVDQVIHPHGLREAAMTFALEVAKRSGKRRRKRSLVSFLLEETPLGRALVFQSARKTVLRKTGGHYPAPLKILGCVRTGLSRGLQKGLAEEAQAFDELVRSPQSRALVSLFFAMTASKKNPLANEARPVAKLGILGAGLMGSGIAQVSAENGFQVLLKDLDFDAISRGERAIDTQIEKKVAKKIITPFERDHILSRIHGVVDHGALSHADLVIEAVFEDLSLKREMLAAIESHAPDHCVFASNTSSLPIGEIAKDAKRPHQVIGMHYFSPVPKMPLLEIVVTDQTADWVTATAIEVGVRQGKNIIVVKDGPGFYTTRILAPMLNEAILLLEEGAEIAAVDRAMTRFGFPVGPVALMDEVGIDVGAHVGDVLGEMFSRRGATPSTTMKKLFEAGFKGRKNGKGFYRYEGKKKKKPVNLEIYSFFGGVQRKNMSAKVIQDRLVWSMINESAHCLHEGILASARDGDLGAILGLGFPPFLGGPFRYLDAMGPGKVQDILKNLEEVHGARFTPAPIFERLGKEGFHGARGAS